MSMYSGPAFQRSAAGFQDVDEFCFLPIFWNCEAFSSMVVRRRRWFLLWFCDSEDRWFRGVRLTSWYAGKD